MSFNTIDNAIFASSESETIQKYFVEKKYNSITDNSSSSNYTTSQIQFTSEVMSNNGKYNNFSEAVMLIPLVFSVEGENVGKSDVFLALKNSNLNLFIKST